MSYFIVVQHDDRHERVYDEKGEFVEDSHLGISQNADHYIRSEDMVDKLSLPSFAMAQELIEKLADGDLDSLEDAAKQYDRAEIV